MVAGMLPGAAPIIQGLFSSQKPVVSLDCSFLPVAVCLLVILLLTRAQQVAMAKWVKINSILVVMGNKISYCDDGEDMEATGCNEVYGLSVPQWSRLTFQLWGAGRCLWEKKSSFINLFCYHLDCSFFFNHKSSGNKSPSTIYRYEIRRTFPFPLSYSQEVTWFGMFLCLNFWLMISVDINNTFISQTVTKEISPLTLLWSNFLHAHFNILDFILLLQFQTVYFK